MMRFFSEGPDSGFDRGLFRGPRGGFLATGFSVFVLADRENRFPETRFLEESVTSGQKQSLGCSASPGSPLGVRAYTDSVDRGERVGVMRMKGVFDAMLKVCEGFIIGTDVMIACGYAGMTGALEAWIGFIIDTDVMLASAMLEKLLRWTHGLASSSALTV